MCEKDGQAFRPIAGGGMPDGLIESPVRFPGDGIVNRGVLIYPETPGPYPGVMIHPGAGGMTVRIVEIGRQVARKGYASLVWDLYSSVPESDMPADTSYPAMVPVFRELDDRSHLIRMGGAFDYLASLPVVQGDRIAVMGFCTPFPLLFACQNPRLRGCISFYNVLRYGEANKADRAVQPIDRVANLWCAWQGHYGEDDAGIPLEQLKELDELGRRFEKRMEQHIYPGCGHSFAEPGGPSYNEKGAETAWSRTFEFLERQLKS